MDYYYPQIFNKKAAVPENYETMKNMINFLDIFLASSKYAAGEELTIADICLVTTIATFDVSAGFDLTPYKNILRWYELCKKNAPGYHFNQEGAEDFKNYFVYEN